MANQTAPVVLRRYSREELFGPLLEDRECGDCAACCTYTQIDTPELVKPIDQTCEHCTGSGCGIYEHRFPVCRGWQCIWKHVDALPDELRPDLSGLMIVLDHAPNPVNVLTRVSIRIIVTDTGKTVANPLVPAVLDMFSQGDLPVWLDDRSGELVLVHPPESIARKLISIDPTLDSTEMPIDIPARSLLDQWKTGVRIQPVDASKHC